MISECADCREWEPLRNLIKQMLEHRHSMPNMLAELDEDSEYVKWSKRSQDLAALFWTKLESYHLDGLL